MLNLVENITKFEPFLTSLVRFHVLEILAHLKLRFLTQLNRDNIGYNWKIGWQSLKYFG